MIHPKCARSCPSVDDEMASLTRVSDARRRNENENENENEASVEKVQIVEPSKPGRQIVRFSASLFRASGEQASHLIARVGVELGEVRQRDDRGNGDDGHEHGGEHEARAVVRPPRVLREETRAHVHSWRRVLSVAARIVFSGPRLARARRAPRRARRTSGTCERQTSTRSRSVNACRAGGERRGGGGRLTRSTPTRRAEGISATMSARHTSEGSTTILEKATVDKAHLLLALGSGAAHAPARAVPMVKTARDRPRRRRHRRPKSMQDQGRKGHHVEGEPASASSPPPPPGLGRTKSRTWRRGRSA